MLEWRCRRLDLDLPPPPSLSVSLSHFVITIYGTKHKEQKSLDLTPLEKERGKWTAVQVERACCLWGVALAIRGNISLAVDFNTTGAAASSILAAVQRFSGTQQAARGEARQGGETISLSWQRQPPRPVAPPGHWLLSQKERTEQREGGRERVRHTERLPLTFAILTTLSELQKGKRIEAFRSLNWIWLWRLCRPKMCSRCCTRAT